MPEGVRCAGVWPAVGIVRLFPRIVEGRSKAELCRAPRPTGVWVQNRAAAEVSDCVRRWLSLRSGVGGDVSASGQVAALFVAGGGPDIGRAVLVCSGRSEAVHDSVRSGAVLGGIGVGAGAGSGVRGGSPVGSCGESDVPTGPRAEAADSVAVGGAEAVVVAAAVTVVGEGEGEVGVVVAVALVGEGAGVGDGAGFDSVSGPL